MLTGGPGPQVDDAIVMDDDDAIVVEDDDAIVIDEEANTKQHTLTQEEKAVLNADEGEQPLWKDASRTRYTSDQLLGLYKKEEKIDFGLLVEDYMELFEVFNQNAQKPFNMDDEVETLDL